MCCSILSNHKKTMADKKRTEPSFYQNSVKIPLFDNDPHRQHDTSGRAGYATSSRLPVSAWFCSVVKLESLLTIGIGAEIITSAHVII